MHLARFRLLRIGKTMKYRIIYLICLITLLSGVIIAQEGEEAIEPVTANADWTPVIQEFDGVEMVLVPAGCFLMGSTDEQIEAAFAAYEEVYCGGDCADLSWIFETEGPQHEFCFDEPFWIDRYEVSNAQFSALAGVAADESYLEDETSGDLPRETITWFESRDFCDLRGARLPNEAEWEYAARGPDSLIFPWGDEFDGTLLNFCDVNCYFVADETIDDGYEGAAPVGSYEGGVSWVGAVDLNGNLWEWASTIYGVEPHHDYALRGEDDDVLFRYPYDPADGREDYLEDATVVRVLRGGSWGDNEPIIRAAIRNWGYPDEGFSHTGFRCARDYE
jgi:formylglycine-generating enzyme required for sulfatase activity